MIFKDECHETLFRSIMQKMNYDDIHHITLAYLIALDDVCRNHVEEMYDFEERCISPECLGKAWQTDTSRKTTRLAYNLYTGSTLFCEDNEISYCSVSDIFCCSYAPYYWQALKIRYPEYTAAKE